MIDEFITPVKPQSDLEAVTYYGQKLSQTPRTERPPVIDNTNKNFKGQQKNEVVLCFSRKHWIVLVPHFIGFGIFLAAVFSFFVFISKQDIEAVMNQAVYRIFAGLAIIGLTFYLHRFFCIFFNYYLQIFIVTNFRVLQLDQTLYFTKNRDSIDLPEIQDILIEQKGIMKTLLNYGEIQITLSSAHATKTLRSVPNPEYFFRKINKTKREYITSRREDKGNIHQPSKNV